MAANKMNEGSTNEHFRSHYSTAVRKHQCQGNSYKKNLIRGSLRVPDIYYTIIMIWKRQINSHWTYSPGEIGLHPAVHMILNPQSKMSNKATNTFYFLNMYTPWWLKIQIYKPIRNHFHSNSHILLPSIFGLVDIS